MKQIKNILYIMGVIAVLAALLFISTAIVQLGIIAAAGGMGIALKEDLLYDVSGTLGTVITGAIAAAYVKKKGYTGCVEVSEPFRIKTCAYYGALDYSICVLFYVITTFLFAYVFSMVREPQAIMEKSRIDILLTDIFFPVLIAPVFEELLFRVGVYSLLRRRFQGKLSILLCTVIFAAIHGYSLQGFCMCFTGGLVYQLIYIHTGNIWYSIAAHMLHNLDANIMNALEHRGVTFLGIPMQYEVNGFNMMHPIFIIAAVLFCGVCVWKRWTRKEKIKGKSCGKCIRF